jgi:hypothetical protein
MTGSSMKRGGEGRGSGGGRRRARRLRIAMWVAVGAVVLFVLYIFPFCYSVRAVWLPWQPAKSAEYRSREYRGGADISTSEFDATESIGRALWPDGRVYHAPGYDPPQVTDSVPTLIVVETPAGSGHFRSYALVGGP